MDRKDEIIQMQNEIMQGLLRQRMQSLGEDLWGIRPTVPQAPAKSAGKSTPHTAAPVNKPVQSEQTANLGFGKHWHCRQKARPQVSGPYAMMVDAAPRYGCRNHQDDSPWCCSS